MQISRHFTYKTFNPNTNDFDKEIKTVWKDADKATEKKLKIFNAIRTICWWLLLPSILGALTCGACADAISMWFVLGFFGSLFLVGACIYYGVDMDIREDRIYENFREENFEEEEIEWLRYNREQEGIASEWREEHPFEEKIRMAQTRGSSVDIAEMVKEYIKLQKGE